MIKIYLGYTTLEYITDYLGDDEDDFSVNFIDFVDEAVWVTQTQAEDNVCEEGDTVVAVRFTVETLEEAK